MAFHDLDTERPAGMGGIQRIPVTRIRAYARDTEVVDIEKFVGLIRQMDDAYVTRVREGFEKDAD